MHVHLYISCNLNDVIDLCVFASVIDCGEPPAYYPDASNYYYAVPHADYHTSVTTYGSGWQYVCREGYKNDFYGTVWLWVTCKADGQWRPHWRSCICA